MNNFFFSLEFLVPCRCRLVKPKLGKGMVISGATISMIWKQRALYLRPSKTILLNTDQDISSDKDISSDEEELPIISLHTPVLFDNNVSKCDEQITVENETQHETNNGRCGTNLLLPSCSTSLQEIQQSTSFGANNNEPSFYTSDLYNEFLGCISDDFDGTEDGAFSNEKVEPIEPNFEAVDANNETLQEISAAEILKDLAQQICLDKISIFNINRRRILDGALRVFKKKGFKPENRISVCFSDDLNTAEGAIDAGGPKREFLRLLLKELFSSYIFSGTENCKYLNMSLPALNDDLYFYAGMGVSLSLIHGGPGPRCFSETTYKSLFEDTTLIPLTIEDVQDFDLRDKLYRFQNAQTLEGLQKAGEDLSELRYFAGSCKAILKLEDKDQILNDVLRGCVLIRCSEARSRFIDGLKTLNLYEMIKRNPKSFETIFCYTEQPLTAVKFLRMCGVVQYSERGSNKFEKEVDAMTFFRDYIYEVEENPHPLQLKDILIFATGCDDEPPLGFDVPPSIKFLHSDGKYPEASTCSLELSLPTIHSTYHEFKSNMDFAMLNTYGFGKY